MERTPLTYQQFEESGEIDLELLKRLAAKRPKDFEPMFFFHPPYQPTETQELLLRINYWKVCNNEIRQHNKRMNKATTALLEEIKNYNND